MPDSDSDSKSLKEETKYEWNQDLDQVEVTFKFSDEITKDDILVKLIGRHLLIKLKGETILDGELLHDVNVRSLYWEIYRQDKYIYVNISKDSNEWWASLLVGSGTVDVQQLAEKRHADISMLDAETKEAVEKMMYQKKAEGTE